MMQRNIKLATATGRSGKGAPPLDPEAMNAGRAGSSLPTASSRESAGVYRVRRPAEAGLFGPLPFWVWALAGALALLGAATHNPVLTPACVLALPILVSLLWRKGETQILLFGCAMQWLQVVTGVFDADFQGAPLEELSGIPNVERATWLSLIGVLVLASGMRLALGRRPETSAFEKEEEARRLSPRRMFTAWLWSLVIAWIAGVVAWRYQGLTQPIYALTSFKWVFFFILAYGVIVQNRNYRWLLAAILIDFSTGWLGYFGSFKEVLYMVILAGCSTRVGLNSRSRTVIGASVVAIVAASLVWSSIKSEYRSFLNQDTGEQRVTGTVSSRFGKLGELISGLDSGKVNEAAEVLVARVSYVEYFAHTLSHVPEGVPYERGKLWLDAVTRILQPRLLFPNKAVTDDSARTMKYTGVIVAGTEQGSSIGIGYMGESYIDFGPYLMFLPIFLLGLLFGFICRYFTNHNRSRLLGTALATAILFTATRAIEFSNIKILGGAVTLCLAMLVYNFVFGARVMNWLRMEKPARRPLVHRRFSAAGGDEAAK